MKKGKRGKPQFMYIGRYLQPRPFWRLRFRHGGKFVRRQAYYDEDYGSKELALEAALAERALVALEYGVDLETHWSATKTKDYRYVQKKAGARNKTGVIGVALYVKGEYACYRASISFERGRETVKSFNCKTFGTKCAFTRAVIQRKKWEIDMISNEITSKVNK